MEGKTRLLERINPFVMGGFLMGAVIMVFLVITLVGLFRTNPYGGETRIDNLTNHYDNLRQSEKDLIYHMLYNALSDNLGEDVMVPSRGALVRDGTAKYEYNKELKVYYGNFIVDIPEVEWSFEVDFEWSPINNNKALDSGYPVVVKCLEESLQIYKNTMNCVDIDTGIVSWSNEYQIDYSFGAGTSCRIMEILREYWTRNDKAVTHSANIIETSLKRLKAQPDITYEFDVDMNGIVYTITVRTDMAYGKEYIAMLMSGNNEKVGFLYVADDVVDAELEGWLVGLSGLDELKIVKGMLKDLQ